MPETTGVITPAARSAASPALFVRALRKRYDDVIAVDGLDLDVLTGQC
jgi:hypothetical protein